MLRFLILSLIYIVSLGLFIYSVNGNRQEPINCTSHVITDNAVVNDTYVCKDSVFLTKECFYEELFKTWYGVGVITVYTDKLCAAISIIDGDIISLDFIQYEDTLNSYNYSMFNGSKGRYYYPQSGILKPTESTSSRLSYFVDASFFEMCDTTGNELVVNFTLYLDGIKVVKLYVFNSESYTISVDFLILNKTSVDFYGRNFYRLIRRHVDNKSFLKGVTSSFVGVAVNTEDKPFKKILFKDLEDVIFQQVRLFGWVAVIERYFISAWVPVESLEYYYVAESLGSDIYSIGFSNKIPFCVAVGKFELIRANLYAGPTHTNTLKELCGGLDLVVDYGIFWPVAKMLFWLLCKLNNYLDNWGFSIIALTILIKMLFYPLSSISYNSMKHTRRLQPVIAKLKEQFPNDKQSYGSAVMSLYKREKVNPLSGCLPLVVQIPFFISLYYVILEAVELRKEPFIFWITDLSTYDAFYVLPILMGVTMFLQQKLSPKPTDEIQEKFMLLLPFVFTFLFLNFPAGLVLYWVVNNSCSILQQWYITYKN